jgi:hypothetical protein
VSNIKSSPKHDWLDSAWEGVCDFVGGAFGLWMMGGCFAELLAIFGIGSGIGCGFCLIPLVIIILLLWAACWVLSLLAPVFWFALLFAPTLWLFFRWINGRHQAGYRSLETIFNGWFGLSDSDNANMSFLISVFLWAMLQVPYFALFACCFPNHV